MNSFTSNFRSEAKVLLVIASCLIVCEAGVRISLPRISKDLDNYREIQRLASEPAGTRRARVLMLGNSLTRYSIVPQLLQAKLERGYAVAPKIDKIGTDDSNIIEWLYLVRHSFSSGPSRPDAIVIGYAEDQITDGAPVHVERLAGYYGGLSIARELFRDDVRDFGSRVDFVISSVSSLYANRDRVRTRLLDAAVPGYRAHAQALNRGMKNMAVVKAGSQGSSYQRLERLLDLCRQRSIHLVVVAMPIPYRYGIDPELTRVVGDHGGIFLDMRNTPGLDNEHFPDGYHLNAAGATIYTRNFAAALSRNAEFNSLLRATSGEVTKNAPVPGRSL